MLRNLIKCMEEKILHDLFVNMGLIICVHAYLYGVRNKPDNATQPDTVSIRYVESECYITGIAVIDPGDPGRLLVGDLASRSIKIVDTRTKNVISCITLQSGPRDLTMTSCNMAAATIPERNIIQFISLENCQLSLDHEVYVYNRCHGLDFDQDKKQFVVSFISPPKIVVMTDDGDFLRRIENIFGDDPRPLYVRFCHLGSDIIVSDVNTGHVTMFSEENRSDFRFSSHALKKPRCMVVLDDNRILVCGWYSHNVLLLSDKGDLLQTVVTEEDGLRFPCALAYSKTEHILYVSAKSIEAGVEIWANLRAYKLDI